MTTVAENSSAPSSSTFASDPVEYLETIARSAPSCQLLSRLAGPVASSMKDYSKSINIAIAPLYLRAVARQLAAETTGGAPPAVAPAAAAAGGGASGTGSNGIGNGNVKLEVEAERKSVHQIYEIAEVRIVSCVCACFWAGIDSTRLIWKVSFRCSSFGVLRALSQFLLLTS